MRESERERGERGGKKEGEKEGERKKERGGGRVKKVKISYLSKANTRRKQKLSNQ